MYNPLSNKRMALDEYRHHLRQHGLGKVIEENEKFLKRHSKIVRYAGNILKKKLEEGISITIFDAHMEGRTLIADDWEDPDLEYRKRISELAKTKST